MQREIPDDWAKTSTTDIINGTRPHMPITKTNRKKRKKRVRKKKIFVTLYRLQHMYKQKQDESKDETRFEIFIYWFD